MLLSEYLRQRGISKSAAAKQAGVPIPSLTRALQGKRGLSATLMLKLVDWSGGAVTPAELLAEAPPGGRKDGLDGATLPSAGDS